LSRGGGLLRFIAKRVALSIGVLFGVTVITFVISRVIVPDPVRAWAGTKAGPSTIAALTAQFHLHDPVYVQFYYYFTGLLSGNWGVSPVTHEPVLYSIGLYLPATLELTAFAVVLTLIIGVPLGILAATNRNRLGDHLSRIVSLSGVASPPFLVALILQFVFFYKLGIFPDSGGQIAINVSAPHRITGFLIIDSLIAGNLPALESALQHIILPGFALAFLTLGLMSRLTRASMLEALASDYVRTAKSKGLSRIWVVYKHALKNALSQPITAMAVYVSYLLGGSVVIESVFSWPGIGRYAAEAALTYDLPSIMGTTIIFAVGVIAANLVADILLATNDPRIRLY
jgi:dipeptide transport system permease protein